MADRMVGALGRGPWTGSWSGSPDNPNAASAVRAMARAIGAASAHAAGACASRNAPLAGFRPAIAPFRPRTGALRSCQSLLGYELYDARLRRLAQSLVGVMTSAGRANHDLLGLHRLPVSHPSAASGSQIGYGTGSRSTTHYEGVPVRCSRVQSWV